MIAFIFKYLSFYGRQSQATTTTSHSLPFESSVFDDSIPKKPVNVVNFTIAPPKSGFADPAYLHALIKNEFPNEKNTQHPAVCDAVF
jgi:hypothetical protein